MMVSRVEAEERTISTISRCSGDRLRLAEQLRRPDQPGHGCPDLVAHGGEEGVLGARCRLRSPGGFAELHHRLFLLSRLVQGDLLVHHQELLDRLQALGEVRELLWGPLLPGGRGRCRRPDGGLEEGAVREWKQGLLHVERQSAEALGHHSGNLDLREEDHHAELPVGQEPPGSHHRADTGGAHEVTLVRDEGTALRLPHVEDAEALLGRLDQHLRTGSYHRGQVQSQLSDHLGDHRQSFDDALAGERDGPVARRTPASRSTRADRPESRRG